ncbi:MAG: hypothetical protein EX270_12965 [Pseudomonadales bacterium]|nr:MAG: hypothetical protein EX270_12965 [Pseudomonadales bacterium]
MALIYVLNFALLLLAYLLRYQSDAILLFAYLFFCSSTLGLISFFKHSEFSRLRRARIAAAKERRNPWFRRLHWLHQHGGLVLQWAIGAIWLLLMTVGEHTLNLNDLLVVLGLITLFYNWRFFNLENKWLSRLVFYLASVLAVYVLMFQVSVEVPHWHSITLLDAPLIALVALLALIIRTTRRYQFRMDTQDILVLLLLLAAPLLTLSSTDNVLLIGAIVRLAILLYASEYIIARIERPAVTSVIAGATLTSYIAFSFF